MKVIHKESEERCGVIVALLGYDFFIGIAPNKKILKNFMVGVQNFRK